jgi:phage tail sheath protein FI
MSIFLSPGVYLQERDLSDIVPRVATAPAALVGYSAKGDVDNIRLMTTDQQFLEQYGEPDASSGHYFHYSALAYLKKGNALYCLRVHNGALYGGVNIMKLGSSFSNEALASGQASSSFTAASGYSADTLFQILGANPGAWNNRIGIKVQNVKDGTDTVATDQYTFEIVVYWQDDDGNWIQVELHKVSRKQKVDGYGKQLHLEEKINGVSSYIIVKDNTGLADTVVPEEQTTRLDLASGDDGSDISDSDLVTGWEEFENPDDVDIRILINGGETSVVAQTAIRDVAEARLDCIAVLDMPFASTSSATSMLTFRNTTQNFNSSYVALYSLWPKIYDAFNDLLIRVPVSGYVAAQYAYNDYVSNVWFAPAGFNRGVLDDALEVTKTDGKALSEGERDVLYQAQINPVQTFRGEGHVIWGQKTEQKKLSALSSVNVRRLLIVLEKAMAIALRPFVDEPNNDLTRFRIEALLNEYLDSLSSQGAFQTEAGDSGFHVVCNETNNTPAVIDSGELRVDVFVKPSRAAEYIRLRVTPTVSGASFEELEARGFLLG